ncbi:MAG: histidine kinase, partial [Verrucomicrobiota bacterium]
ELAALGKPVVGQTVAEFGYQHPRLSAPPLVPPWVQIDLQTPRALDWVALVPAQVDWQSLDRPAYGFPKRFRVDLSNDENFHEFSTIADLTDADFPDPGIAPVAFRARGAAGRFLRVTVTKAAIENNQHFFAFAEVIAIAGNRNVAASRPVKVSTRYELPPRWSQANLVDGRVPLGPPIRRELLDYDGLFTSGDPGGPPPMMQIELGREVELQEIRLHPVHARIGADAPGFSFPKSFRIEADSDHTPSALLFEAVDFPNPGNNPVTIPLDRIRARTVRIVALPSGGRPQPRFGLSEFEIYAAGANVARQGRVRATRDTVAFSSHWPIALLVDGYTSYGRLLELPDWLEAWNRRRELQIELAALAQESGRLLDGAWSRAFGLGVFLLAGALAALVLAALRSRRRRQSEFEAMRLRLARDLHDEIGSNLAGIAILSEMGIKSDAGKEDWHEVHQIVRETIHSMREVLWVLGARQEAGFDLLEQLPRTARRMLPGCTLEWKAFPTQLPAQWPVEARRQVFLLFKETLANIARHARASRVELEARLSKDLFELKIHDNGVGFDMKTVRSGMGLPSLRERGHALRGRVVIHSTPGGGTTILLHAPLDAKRHWLRAFCTSTSGD